MRRHWTLAVVVSFFALAGCNQATLAKYYSQKQGEYRAANENVHLTSGEKILRGDQRTIMKGILSGFADLNMSVVNVDQSLGFLSATGVSVLPGDRERVIVMPVLEKYSSETGVPHQYTPGNYEVVANVSIYEYDKQEDASQVKLRLVSRVHGPQQIKNNELMPELLEAHYRYIWEKIGKHVFIESETQS